MTGDPTVLLALLTAFLNVLWGVVSSVVKLRWSNEFKEAKNAEINTLRTTLETLATAKDETIRAKEAQIAAIKQQLDTLRELTSEKLFEHLTATKRGLESAIRAVEEQLEAARGEVRVRDTQIQALTQEGTRQEETIRIMGDENRAIQASVDRLSGELERVRADPFLLLRDDIYGAVFSSSVSLASSLTTRSGRVIGQTVPLELQSLGREAHRINILDTLRNITVVEPLLFAPKEETNKKPEE